VTPDKRADIARKDPSGPEAAEDQVLVRRVQEGERDAFTLLVRRHERSVYWILHGILQNQADVEEVLQESFLKAFVHIQGFRGEARFSTWLTQIAINEARMRLRKYRPALYDSLDEEPPEGKEFRPRELADWRPNPEEDLSQEEMAALLQRAIRALPRIYREVFLLRDVERLTNEEAATVLAISVPATKTRLLRARLMVREFLAPHLRTRWHDRLRRRGKGQGRSG